MLISELKKDTSSIMAWGVEIDEEVFDPPANLKLVGLLWEGTGPTEITDALIDTVISFSLSGAEVIVEVRPKDEVDPEYLLTLAGNAQFSVSLIPPEDEAELPDWCEQCARFSRALLTVPNFAGTLVPVSGYQTYLILELFAAATALKPSDPYTLQRFVEAVPEAWSDQAKAAMRRAMSEELGGEALLKDYLGSILRALRGEADLHVIGGFKVRAEQKRLGH